MRANHSLLLIIGAVCLLCAGCAQVEDLAGVSLATVSPTPTAVPRTVVLPLPHTATKDFLGTVVSINYPEGWQVAESGQSLSVFDPDIGEPGGAGLGIGMFIALTRSVGITEGEDAQAPLVMNRFLARAAAGGAVPPESAPAEDGALAFTWGGHDAAVFRWQSEDGAAQGIQLLVLDEDKRRFVIIATQPAPERWPDFQATWLNMMGTFTLNDTGLPLSDLQAALDAFGG